MDMSFQQIQSQEVYSYVRELLTWDDSLSANLRTLPIEAGKCQILLPPAYTPPPDLDLFAVNSVLKGYLGHNRVQAASYIAAFIEEDINHIALFASFARLGDPGLEKIVTRQIVVPRSEFPPSIFLCIDRSSYSIADIMTAFSKGRGVTSLVVLTSTVPGMTSAYPGTVLTKAQIRELCQHTAHLVCAVYDGESYLVWTAG
jgi:hypothetical protein